MYKNSYILMAKVLLSLYKVIWKEEIFKENSSTTQAFKGFLSLFEKNKCVFVHRNHCIANSLCESILKPTDLGNEFVNKSPLKTHTIHLEN